MIMMMIMMIHDHDDDHDDDELSVDEKGAMNLKKSAAWQGKCSRCLNLEVIGSQLWNLEQIHTKLKVKKLNNRRKSEFSVSVQKVKKAFFYSLLQINWSKQIKNWGKSLDLKDWTLFEFESNIVACAEIKCRALQLAWEASAKL